MEQSTPANLFDLQLDQQAGSYLGEAARWARFLSILGFILCGLMVLMGAFLGSRIADSLSNMGGSSMLGGGFFSMIYVLIALIYFFPCLYLFHFGTKMRTALTNNDQETLSASLKNLKSCFKFFGVLAIIVLSLYALAIIALIIGGVAGH
ncbi:MAG: DUF5362 family protein [Bacteroidota bacterium]|nr:DUF5362 family protein [Bacteroidota bacterium]MDP4212088.1 DUF5362 family protein [Bacteroidota bacterium]MDP4249297.1 DUF5362 family protein [Bacteroidota bacterium]